MPTAYDQDFFRWTQDQAAALRKVASGKPDAATGLDWENLAEEIESLGRSELRAMESALVRVVEHLLKLRYSPARDPRAGWQESVDLHRDDLQRLKRDNPGLVRRIDLAGIYASARRIAGKSIEKHDGVPASVLPPTCPFTLEQIETDDWYPEPLHS
jgi:hypothetical protein